MRTREHVSSVVDLFVYTRTYGFGVYYKKTGGTGR